MSQKKQAEGASRGWLWRGAGAAALLAGGVAGLYLLVEEPAPAERWYDDARVEAGATLFRRHCADCHGEWGEATVQWRRPDADGRTRPPPLNGTAHTWHHPFKVLARQVKYGTVNQGGSMPGFGETLSDEELTNVIAWVQSLWSDDIYARWWKIQEEQEGS